MYHAKEHGSNNYRFFKEDMNVQAVRPSIFGGQSVPRIGTS